MHSYIVSHALSLLFHLFLSHSCSSHTPFITDMSHSNYFHTLFFHWLSHTLHRFSSCRLSYTFHRLPSRLSVSPFFFRCPVLLSSQASDVEIQRDVLRGRKEETEAEMAALEADAEMKRHKV